jgi:plasmid stabilization system protein ParE
MKIIFTETALTDLDEIFEYLASNYPTLVDSVEQRIDSVLARLERDGQKAHAR